MGPPAGLWDGRTRLFFRFSLRYSRSTFKPLELWGETRSWFVGGWFFFLFRKPDVLVGYFNNCKYRDLRFESFGKAMWSHDFKVCFLDIEPPLFLPWCDGNSVIINCCNDSSTGDTSFRGSRSTAIHGRVICFSVPLLSRMIIGTFQTP
jgi:hypothetical protein